jgi:hypothetical protein
MKKVSDNVFNGCLIVFITGGVILLLAMIIDLWRGAV